MNVPINKQWAKLIEVTQYPLAPIDLQQAHSAIHTLGRMMAGVANKEHVNDYTRLLMASFTDQELEKASRDPSFTMALASMLAEAMVNWKNHVCAVHTKPSEED